MMRMKKRITWQNNHVIFLLCKHLLLVKTNLWRTTVRDCALIKTLTSSWKTSFSSTMLGWPWHILNDCSSRMWSRLCKKEIHIFHFFLLTKIQMNCKGKIKLSSNGQILPSAHYFNSKSLLSSYVNAFPVKSNKSQFSDCMMRNDT